MGKHGLTEDEFTLHVTSTVQGTSHYVDVEAKDTIGDVTEKAAKELEVGVGDITLYHEGVALHNVGENVTDTMLVEGSEVEARPSKKVVAKRALGDMGLEGSSHELWKVVTDEKEDSWKAMVSQMVLDADEGLDVGDATCEAASRGLLETVKVLSSRDVNAKDRHGSTPLLHAFEHAAIVEYLIKAGADLEAANYEGSTTLHRAAMEDRLDVVECLVQAGANVEASDTDGETALDWAKSLGYDAVVSALRRES